MGKETGESGNEQVSTVKAAEESNNSVQSFINLIICQLLESLSELIVTIERNKMRCLGALIHKVLETQVSGFLKPHIVIECLLNQIVHLALELKEFEGELVWVFQVLLILDNLGALQQDIRVHLVYDVD